jgi:hypothetical protein
MRKNGEQRKEEKVCVAGWHFTISSAGAMRAE